MLSTAVNCFDRMMGVRHVRLEATFIASSMRASLSNESTDIHPPRWRTVAPRHCVLSPGRVMSPSLQIE